MLKRSLAFICAAVMAGPAAAQSSCLDWGSEFLDVLPNGTIRTSVAASTPDGPVLFVGGRFSKVGAKTASNVAYWTGTEWGTMEPAIRVNHGTTVNAMAYYDDDGPGPNPPSLFIGGFFNHIGGVDTTHIARWDGTSWSAVGGGLNLAVNGLCVFDDDGPGPGLPSLYAVGPFDFGGGNLAVMARWNGTAWTPIYGTSGGVNALTVYDGELIAGGAFTSIGGVTASGIARWNGQTWRPMGMGIGPNIVGVKCFAEHDDGTGRALYVAGRFEAAGGTPVNSIAKWNGEWSPVGDGIRDGSSTATINSLASFDDGAGPRLYAGGTFRPAPGYEVDRFAVWDGQTWAQAATVSSSIEHLTTFDTDGVRSLLVFGPFSNLAGLRAKFMAERREQRWMVRGQSFPAEQESATIFELGTFDLGSGPRLFASGSFRFAGPIAADSIAQWDGRAWAPLGIPDDGTTATAYAMHQFPAGAGNPVYFGGGFEHVRLDGETHAVRGIGAWDGANWSPVEAGLSSGGLSSRAVLALQGFNDGSGEKLFLGGQFAGTVGRPLNHVARYTDDGWESFDTDGLPNTVRSAVYFDDGTGSALYVGGWFKSAGGDAACGVAKWDGTRWVPVGDNLAGNQRVFSLAVFDDGSGPALYAAGEFDVAGNPGVCRNVARWNGTVWEPLDVGIFTHSGGRVNKLLVFDPGTGPALYAVLNRLYRWTGTTWVDASGVLTGSITDICLYDPDSSGPEPAWLATVGNFTRTGTNGLATNVATWDGTRWYALGSGIGTGATTIGVFDDGSGVPKIVVAGNALREAGGQPVSKIAIWNRASWSPMGTGIQSNSSQSIDTITTFDDGNGPALYVGGVFAMAGGLQVDRIARWDGTAWSRPPGVIGGVYSLRILDGPSGPEFIACGGFSSASGLAAPNVIAWDESGWHLLADGLNAGVSAFAVFDPDGAGAAPPELYAGGSFAASGPHAVSGIARWTGSGWAPVGGAIGGSSSASVVTFALFDDGTGEALYAGGGFSTAGGVPAVSLARWNGSAWSAVGSGPRRDDGSFGSISRLFVHDDGGGPALYAAGRFASMDGVPASNIARWNGVEWSALGSGVNADAYAMASFEHEGELALVVGGAFRTAGDRDSPLIATWKACENPVCPGDWDGSGGVDGDDIGAFFADWQMGDADIDQSGGTDGDDITYFFERWQAGC